MQGELMGPFMPSIHLKDIPKNEETWSVSYIWRFLHLDLSIVDPELLTFIE